MRAGPIAHGALLFAALGFAYQTWTRDTSEPPKLGSFTIWNEPSSAFTAFAYDGENKSIRVETRQEGDDSFLWGTITRSQKKKKHKVRVPGGAAPSAPGGHGADDGHGHGAKPDDSAHPGMKAIERLKGKRKGAKTGTGTATPPVPSPGPAPKAKDNKKPGGSTAPGPKSPHMTETTDAAETDPAESTDSSSADPASDATAAPEPAVEEEIETTTRSFPVGENGVNLVKSLSHLRALRDLGTLKEEQKEEYGLVDAKENLTVFFSNGAEHSLIIGSRVVGGSDRYVLSTETGKGYVIAYNELVQYIDGSESSLGLRYLHSFQEGKFEKKKFDPKGAKKPATVTDKYPGVHSVEIVVGADKRSLLRAKTTDPKGTEIIGWSRPEAPETPDLSLANFISQVERLKPTEYPDDLDESTLTPVMSMNYQAGDGKTMGNFVLYKKAATSPELTPEVSPEDTGEEKPADDSGKIEYFVKTELTRVPGPVGRMAAERVEQDLPLLLGKSEATPGAPEPVKKPDGKATTTEGNKPEPGGDKPKPAGSKPKPTPSTPSNP